MKSVTTITFFRYEGIWNRLWAFWMMQGAHASLAKVHGLEFYKLMGSGKDGQFGHDPDWGAYVLLQNWKDEQSATDFFSTDPLMERYRNHAVDRWTLYMNPIRVKGTWNGQQPFNTVQMDSMPSFTAVLTRATLRWKTMRKFWRYVPEAQKGIFQMPGLRFAKGVGEMPFKHMATFSIWSDVGDITQWAYKNKEHKKAIEMTKTYDWYSEEMFARFAPYRSEGTWKGERPLPELPQD
jgi:hypothetical protein